MKTLKLDFSNKINLENYIFSFHDEIIFKLTLLQNLSLEINTYANFSLRLRIADFPPRFKNSIFFAINSLSSSKEVNLKKLFKKE
jgi:hypothetical protein